jgi:hypothetical protein
MARARLGPESATDPSKADTQSPPKPAVEEPLQPGLMAVFYEGVNFDRFLRVTRHPGLYFTWTPTYPGGVPGEHMSARFVGQLQIREPGKYLFRFVSESGTRLYLDGKKVIEEWAGGKRGQLRRAQLDQGMHSVWVEFKNATGNPAFALHWERGGREMQVPDGLCFWDPLLWQRICREPGRDPLAGLKPGPAGPPEPPAVTEKEAPPTPQGLAAKGLGVLRPLWAKRQYAEAAARAKALAAEPDYAAAPELAGPLVEDAQALLEFWRAVEAGAAKLEPGESVRVAGIAGEFQKLNGGSISIKQGAVAITKALTDLNNEELVSLARRAGGAKTGRDHLRLALFWLYTARPDPARAQAELALAEEAGIDVSRYRLPKEAPKPPQTVPQKDLPPKEAPAKDPPRTEATFETAVRDAQASLDQKDYRALAKAIDLAVQLKPREGPATRQLDELYASIMDRAVLAGKSLESANAKALLGAGETLKPRSADVRALTAWLGKFADPTLAEDFDSQKLGRWDLAAGVWKVQGAHLICPTSVNEARIFLKDPRPKDFVLEFSVLPGGGAFTSHLGAVFRDTPARRILFAFHEEKSLVVAGGEGDTQGISVEFMKDEGRYRVQPGNARHVAIRCLGKDFECYVDGELWARGTDESSAPGRVGFLAQGGEMRFRSIRLYKAIPLPELSFSAKEGESAKKGTP